MENHHFEWESTINGPFSIAMLNNQRVYGTSSVDQSFPRCFDAMPDQHLTHAVAMLWPRSPQRHRYLEKTHKKWVIFSSNKGENSINHFKSS